MYCWSRLKDEEIGFLLQSDGEFDLCLSEMEWF